MRTLDLCLHGHSSIRTDCKAGDRIIIQELICICAKDIQKYSRFHVKHIFNGAIFVLIQTQFQIHVDTKLNRISVLSC